MSVQATAPLLLPDETAHRRRWLAPVPERILRRARPRLAYVAVVIVGIGVIVVSQLALSIGLSDGAYEISSLQSSQKDLGRTNQDLTEQLQLLDSPQYLVQHAEALGMVANGNTVYLRLSDGAILGSPDPASLATAPITSGQGGLVANALLNPPTVAPSAPATPPVDPALPWQGALPSPTTH
jgi:hypothetical protein